MKTLTFLQQVQIIEFANQCEQACRYAEKAEAQGHDKAAKAWRARAAYWSGRAFGEVLK